MNEPMREQLNNNPLVQVGVLGVLLLAAGVFFISTMGGGKSESEEPAAGSAEVTTSAGTEAVAVVSGGAAAAPESSVPAPSPGALAASAPPPPSDVVSAFKSGRTVVLLFVRDGGIDDRLVARSTERLSALQGVTAFVVPARRIARYARITQGVEVSRVPALVILDPRRLDHGTPSASVYYGFQSPASVVQAVVDAGYKGRTVPYHP